MSNTPSFSANFLSMSPARGHKGFHLWLPRSVTKLTCRQLVALPFSFLTNGFIVKGCKARSPVSMKVTGHPVAATLERVKLKEEEDGRDQ